jgi:hypothetical protein
MPDIKRHYVVSMGKSVMRIAGYAALLESIPIAVIILILSEILGIVEENV